MALGCIAIFLVTCDVAQAEIQCGFGCTLNNNKLTIDLFIEYSSEVARLSPYPPAILYGWGVFSLKQIDETVTRSKTNRITLEESAWVQVGKFAALKALTVRAPAWNATRIAQRLSKAAVHTVKDYAGSGLFEAGYALSRGNTTDNTNSSKPEEITAKTGISDCNSSSPEDPMCEENENSHSARWRWTYSSSYPGETGTECITLPSTIEGFTDETANNIIESYSGGGALCAIQNKSIINYKNSVFRYHCRSGNIYFSGTYEIYVSENLLRTIRTQQHNDGDDVQEEVRYEQCN